MQVAEIPRPRPPHRVPLGLLMLSRGDLNNTQLREALEAQRQDGTGRIGEWIQRLGYARELQVTGALALQWSCPVIKGFPKYSQDYILPLALLRRFRMVPIKLVPATRVFHIAFAGDIDYRALLAIEQILECKTEVCLTSSAALESSLEAFEQLSRRNDKTIEEARPPDEMTRIALSYVTKLKAERVRTVACDQYVWLRIKHGRELTNLLFEGHRDAAIIGAQSGTGKRSRTLFLTLTGQAFFRRVQSPAPRLGPNILCGGTSPPLPPGVYPAVRALRSP
jgi:hypothetical protein